MDYQQERFKASIHINGEFKMNLELNKKYLTGPIANTDLHAGGLFFCIIYQNCLEFSDNGNVTLTKKIMDAFRPMDENDVRHLENYRITGKYHLNERGYLICDFEDLLLQYTGLPTEKNPSVIPFHIYDKRFASMRSEVYIME